MIVLLAWTWMEKLVGLHDEHIDKHPIYTNFFALVAIVVYYLGIREKRNKDYNGKMTWLQGLTTGAIISLVVTILTPLGVWFTQTVITPDYFDNAIEFSVENGYSRLEEAEDYFSLKNYIIQSVIFAPVVGVATSAVIALFVRRS